MNLWRDMWEDFCPSNQSQGVRVTYALDSPGSLPNPKYIQVQLGFASAQ